MSGTSRIRRKRVVIPVATIVGVIGVFAVLWWAGHLVPGRAAGGSSMSPTIPACDGRWLAEGFTYRFRDPHHGEVVAIHARGQLGGPVVPDPKARDLNLGKRVIGIPGDSVVGRGGRVYVNGKQADDIPTDAFPLTVLATSSTSSSATIAASRRTAATSGPYRATRSSPAWFSSTGRSNDSVYPATTRTSSRLGRFADRDLSPSSAERAGYIKGTARGDGHVVGTINL